MPNSEFVSIQDELRTIAQGEPVVLSKLAQALLSTTVEFIQKDSPDTLEEFNAIQRRFQYGHRPASALTEEQPAAQDKPFANPFDDKADSYLNITFREKSTVREIAVLIDSNIPLGAREDLREFVYEFSESMLYLDGKSTSPFRSILPFERILRGLNERFEHQLAYIRYTHEGFKLCLRLHDDTPMSQIHDTIVDIIKDELYGPHDEPSSLNRRIVRLDK